MCMIKFDILANKGMGYNKGKIEKKKWFYVFCVTKIIFDFWASIQVVYQNIVFSYQFYISLKLINKYETSIQVSPDHKYQINLATIFVLVCLICVDHKCSHCTYAVSYMHDWEHLLGYWGLVWGIPGKGLVHIPLVVVIFSVKVLVGEQLSVVGVIRVMVWCAFWINAQDLALWSFPRVL